jgi:hypothetical protein
VSNSGIFIPKGNKNEKKNSSIHLSEGLNKAKDEENETSSNLVPTDKHTYIQTHQ